MTLDALGVEPPCHCLRDGADAIDFDGAPLVQHFVGCAWLEWERAHGGCMGDPDESDVPVQPATELEAIGRLADAVGLIAWRCWEALGTAQSERIQVECNVIAEWAAQRGVQD